ncbi:hypothetical protein EC991_005791 [Linnemannia zychae]|nr:hypothetical protein EC991_005791 [Linnemannia zychae]
MCILAILRLWNGPASAAKACPKLDRDLTDGSPDQQMRFQTHSNSGEVDNSQAEGDDMDQDDYDAIQELRVLGQYDRLEDSSYSRFQVEGLREQLATKKRQLHKQLWAAERRQRQRQHQRIEAEIYSSLNSVVSFTTLTDPTSLHAGGCVAHCHEVLACGTETAPEYHGIQQIKSPSSHAG